MISYLVDSRFRSKQASDRQLATDLYWRSGCRRIFGKLGAAIFDLGNATPDNRVCALCDVAGGFRYQLE